MSFRFAIGLLCLSLSAQTRPEAHWGAARSAHFEVYSHDGEETARAALAWFEQLRAFFTQQTGLNLDTRPPVRVIGFHSVKEYDPYRLRPTADAYFAAGETRDYIVMATLEPAAFSVAAHEYAHLVLHTSALSLPPWLEEGLAEFYSTVRIGETGSSVGGEQPGRVQVLKTRPWIPLADLLGLAANGPLRQNRDTSAVFYAESSALSAMLVLEPAYAPRFPELLAALHAKTPGAEALPAVFGRSLAVIERDLHRWIAARRAASALPGVPAEAVAVRVAALSAFETRALMAEILLVMGRLDPAESLYRQLAREDSGGAEIPAALGSIAMRRGDTGTARLEWKRAIERGADDAVLCYRYAILAGQAGLAGNEIRPALERAVSLNPDYDDARYSLALLEKNAGHEEIALAHLRAMRSVAPGRAFQYWSATADALNQLGRREEAKAAARTAAAHATSAEDRARAAQLEYIAETDMTVRFARDAEGRQQLVTTRIPHDTADWNPFVEPGDDYRRAAGKLLEVDCSGTVTRLVIQIGDSRLVLAISDPSRVQMRQAPSEFTCGLQQPPATVTVEYAARKSPEADGIVTRSDVPILVAEGDAAVEVWRC